MKLFFKLFFLCGSVGFAATSHAQYSHLDTLRGSITPERVWWDLQHYELSVKVDPSRKSIEGSNLITYSVLEPASVIQIDLQTPLQVHSFVQNDRELEFTKEGPHHFVKLQEEQVADEEYVLEVTYGGKPHEAIRAPWDGGFTWAKDNNGNDFVATSCQGIGASLWWPCKDHMYDEPDRGIVIHATVPSHLTAVCNGRLVKSKKADKGYKTYTWEVVNPINNYGVNINIADYAHFSEKYEGEKGSLDMDYWVLSYELEKAKVHFEDAPKLMEAFEHWFGPYPFYEDGYKLVEVPYWGMEHQSSVTYGNEYKKGMKGRDHTSTGWGTKFDFIIIHESGHEWFANNITNKDVADMWIHESFTCYSESIFLEYYYGKDAAAEYIKGSRGLIENHAPIISDYDVNTSSHGADMYYKGSNMLHTLRQRCPSDSLWRAMLRGLNETFYHQTVSTDKIEGFMAKTLNLNLDTFFNQYLRDKRIPVLEYRIVDNTLHYRWTNCIEGFDMPVRITVDGKETVLQFEGTNWNSLESSTPVKKVKVDSNYYVYSTNLMGVE